MTIEVITIIIEHYEVYFSLERGYISRLYFDDGNQNNGHIHLYIII